MIPKHELPELSGTSSGALGGAARFVRHHVWRLSAISAALVVPCFWHRHLEAGDLGSHLYNAWLVQLIERGEAPGLWVGRQWNNVLFDWLLGGLGSLFGLHAAERIAVALAVLVFFWGAFALVCAAVGKAPWFVAPLLAAVAHGWTFEMGLFNYYVSIGLAFFGIALFWRGRGWERLAPLLVAPVAYVAHPLGLGLLVAIAIYIGLGEVVRGRWRLALFLGAAGALVAAHFYLGRHFVMDPPDDPYYVFNGSDQLLLFGTRYQVVAWGFLLVVLVAVAMDLIRRWRERGDANSAGPIWKRFGLALEMYALIGIGVFALPDGIHLPEYPAAVALLTERLTSVSAVLLICLLAAMRPRRWHVLASAGVALIFFGFLFEDTGRISAMETRVEELVRTIPRDSRVMATILSPPGSRVVMQHIVDRACIGWCFSYGNYEAASQQFRVRAREGNPYVMTSDKNTAAMEEGWYEATAQDLPAWAIYQCGSDETDLCIRALEEGEAVDEPGVHPK